MIHADTIRRMLNKAYYSGFSEAERDEAIAAIDALLAERDEWKMAAGAEAELANEYHAENQQLRDALEQAHADLESILPPRGHEELAQGVYFAHQRIDKALAAVRVEER
jgi:hypothetical protein